MPKSLEIFRQFGTKLFMESYALNIRNMARQLAYANSPRDVLDLGCGDGHVTLEITAALVGGNIRAVEQHEPSRIAARDLGVDAVPADLEQRLPFESESFDVVLSNQVIEHLADTDNFVAEIHRVLRPGGIAVVATENMASWHNIFALVLGFQPFSSSNYSRQRYPLGNPIALHAGLGEALDDGMMHRRIFTPRALRELFDAHSFDVVDVQGSGYHPLPPIVGRFDVSHSHFISIAGRKRMDGTSAVEATTATRLLTGAGRARLDT